MTLAEEARSQLGGRIREIAPTWTQIIFAVLILNIVLAALIGLLRLLDFTPPWVSEYAKVINAVVVAIAAVDIATRRRIHVDALTVLMAAMVPIGFAIGMFSGGEFRYFISHFFVGLFVLALYVVGTNADMQRTWLEWWVSKASAVTLIAYVLSIGLFHVIDLLGEHRLYPGVGTGDLVLPFSYYSVRRRWRLAALAALLVLLSGKRGPMLALLLVLLMLIGLRYVRNLYVAVALSAGFGAIVVLVSFLIEPFINVSALPLGLDGIAAKWYSLNPFSPEFNLALGTSGRSAEIEWALLGFNAEPWRWVIGAGYGWSYFNGAIIPGTETREFVTHYVHFSPLNFLFLYGLPLAVLFFALLTRVIAIAYERAADLAESRSVYVALVLTAVGALAGGLTAYSYAVDPMLWVTVGLVATQWRFGHEHEDSTVADGPHTTP